jgi:hypothetical protein
MLQRVLEPFETGPTADIDGCRLEVAALLEKRTHTAGIGWRLTVEGHLEPAEGRTLHRAGTLMGAELSALREGLRRAARASCTGLRLRIPDPRVVAVIEGTGADRYPRARATAAGLGSLLRGFRSIRYETEFEPDHELSHVVAEALDAGLHVAAAREEHRVWVMERILERAREVRLQRTESGWVANERYHVQLEPMRCDCPAWTVRWSKTPIAGRRAQRLPCKHLVALALHEGITVPVDLAELARRAPA